MGLIAKLFRAASKEEMEGLCMGTARAWRVSGIDEAAEFLRALPDLLPEDSILYLEGTSASDIIDYVKARRPEKTTKIALGTIWPKPPFYHMLITPQNLSGLSGLAEHHVEPELCIHLHVYRGETILLEWYDAFDDPLRISPDIDQQRIQQFCSRLRCTYAKEPEV